MTVRPGEVAAAFCKGLASGAVGTAVMTAAQRLEMNATDRDGSSAPADVVEKLLGLRPVDEEAEERLGLFVHWAYGTGLGAPRGLLAAAGLKGPVATLAHFGIVWAAALTVLPALGLAPPPTKWGKGALAKDAGFHALYAVATGLAYDLLDRRDGASPEARQRRAHGEGPARLAAE